MPRSIGRGCGLGAAPRRITGWARKILTRPVFVRLAAGAAVAALLASLVIAQQPAGGGYAGATVSVRFADATDAVGAVGLAFSDIATQSVTATASASVIFQNAVEEYNASRSYLVAFGEDNDSDLVPDSRDQCPGTPFEADIDANGCAHSQVDQDLDGVCNAGASSPRWCTGTDICPNTPPGTIVDGSGCPVGTPVDSDGDGLPDASDPTPDDANGDYDKDGLLDTWEILGIDYDHNGSIDLDLRHIDDVPADPRTRDIFLEVDYMDCAQGGCAPGDNHSDAPDPNALHDVAEAFKKHGIALHLVPGEATPHVERIRFQPAQEFGPLNDFDDLKWGFHVSELFRLNPGVNLDDLAVQTACASYAPGWFFGTLDVRSDNCVAGISARRQAYRYAFFAHDQTDFPGRTGIAEGPGSQAPYLNGNDLMITLGHFSDEHYRVGGGTRDLVRAKRQVQAGILLHELGHTLGLGHGGGDDKNCKPNYLSVMNYSLQFPSLVPTRPLEYSTELLPPLDGQDLEEMDGVAGAPGQYTVYGVYDITSGNHIPQAVSANGPIDWNYIYPLNSFAYESNVSADISRIDKFGCPATRLMNGHNDWVRIDLLELINFKHSLRYSDDLLLFQEGKHVGSGGVSLELTIDAVVQAAQLIDFDEDEVSNANDNCPAVYNPDQADVNGNGIGDACEGIPAETVPPVVVCGVADGLWQAGDAIINCSANDAGAGLANPKYGNFGLSTHVPAGIEGPNSITESQTVCDRADNCAGAGPIGGNRVDKKAPDISISTPVGATYTFGQAVQASYNCTDGGSGVASCAGNVPSGMSIDTNSLGPKTFTVNASDNVGNTSSRSVNYTVTAAPTTGAVSVTPTTQQYSDRVTLTATLSPPTLAGQAPASNVTLMIGSQIIATVPLTASGGTLQASLPNVRLREPLPFGTSPTGQMAPGPHTVTAVFGGVSSNFIVANATTTLTIAKEDARATYTGALFASTACVTCSTATLTLSATVQDISAVPTDSATDATEGDIRNAKVTFQIVETGQMITGVPVGLVNSADTRTGTATKNVTVNLGASDAMTLTVRVIVDGYYTSPVEQAVVMVMKPLSGGFIAGGGYLTMTHSSGQYPGQPGSKNNFGFIIKYDKTKTNLHGGVITLVRSKGRVYLIRGNTITSLSTNSTARTATFNAKGSIQDVTHPANPIFIDGNAMLQVTMTDKSLFGNTDTLGITVWNESGGLWFSSNWTGTRTLEQLLARGNLVIR